jgi:hypothetical protein
MARLIQDTIRRARRRAVIWEVATGGQITVDAQGMGKSTQFGPLEETPEVSVAS